MKINYYSCRYQDAEHDDHEDEAFGKYPCSHPENHDGDCPLANKQRGQRDYCALLDKG